MADEDWTEYERWAEQKAKQHDLAAKNNRESISVRVEQAAPKYRASTMGIILRLAEEAEWHEREASWLRRGRNERLYWKAYEGVANG